MEDIMAEYGFVPLGEFLVETLGMSYGAMTCDEVAPDNDGISRVIDRIYIKLPGENGIPMLPTESKMPAQDILDTALSMASRNSQIAYAYNKKRKKWCTSSLQKETFQSEIWAKIFKILGDAYSLYILTNCHVAREQDGRFLYICGNFNELRKVIPTLNSRRNTASNLNSRRNTASNLNSRRETVNNLNSRRDTASNLNSIKNALFKNEALNRKRIFSRNGHLQRIDPQAVLDFAFGGIKNYSKIKDECKYKIIKSIQKYNKVPMNRLFCAYFMSLEPVCPVEANQIANFLFLISKKFLGPVFDFQSFKILKGKLALLVKRNSRENISESVLVSYFQLNRLKLFEGKCMRHETAVRARILSRVLMWLFESVYIPIISHYFHATISQTTHFKILYYKRLDWYKATAAFYREYLGNEERFARISQDDSEIYRACEGRRTAISSCVPKEHGYRAVMNCSRASKKTINKKSINSSMWGLLPIIRNGVKRMNCGNSMLGHRDVHRKLLMFLKNKPENFYLLKIDVKECFDNINLEVLSEIAQEYFSEESCCCWKYSVLSANGPMSVSYSDSPTNTDKMFNNADNRNKARTNDDENTGAESSVINLERFAPQCIVRENGCRRFEKSEILDLISTITEGVYVYNGGSYYKMRKGIPQGCSISSLLCSAYYNHYDNLHFKDAIKSGMIVRYVDDTLIMTPSIEEAQTFLERCGELRDKGFKLNYKKLEANFPVEMLLGNGTPFPIGIDDTRQEMGDAHKSSACGFNTNSNCTNDNTQNTNDIGITKNEITWCGLRIYSNGSGIKCQHSDPQFRHAISCGSKEEGANIFKKLKYSFRIKTNVLLISSWNKRCYENIYDTFYLLGRKTRILFGRASFVNAEYANRILGWFVNETIGILKERRIFFGDDKVFEMAGKAYKSSGAHDLKFKKFQR